MLLALIALLAAPVSTTSGFDATRKGTAGVSFALPGGGGPTVGFTWFLNDDVAARLDFGLDATLSPSGTPATFSLGLGLRFYQFKRNGVALFLQPSVAFGREILGIAPLGGAEAGEFFDLAGAVGVEYFFTDHFSAGGTLGLGLGIHNLGGPGGSSVQTRLSTRPSGLFANVYF